MESREGTARWFLKPLQVDGLPERIEFESDGLSLGRSETNSVIIPEHGFPYVSSAHARIHVVDGTLYAEDLGSKNGTLVNGRRIDRCELHNGDVIQLGNMGPRFAVVSTNSTGDTMPTMHFPAGDKQHTRDLSQSTLMRIKSALGIPKDTDVGTLIQTRGRRGMRIAWAAFVAVVLMAGGALWVIANQQSAEAETLDEIREVARGLELQQSTLQQQKSELRGEKERLETESNRLGARLEKLEKSAGASASELAALNEELNVTRHQLQLFDPVNIEQTRLRDVRLTTRAVVFIETKTFLEHSDSDQLLYLEETADGEGRLNLDGAGEPYSFESSGSGFAVTDAGWILTNAHVVRPDRTDGPLAAIPETSFESVVELSVVFSGTSRRHPARLIRWILEPDCDLALLKIEPFADMPYIESIDIDLPPPEAMSEVYLSGFPLGKMAVQQGETLIASTFKGILSRIVQPYYQVDAATHPGNSGGPAMDNRGRIVGVVTRVQRTPRGPYAPTIGYITPVSTVGRIWPPRDSDSASK